MALSLGVVMVSPHALRWLSSAAALVVSMTFGIGVLATGWHRPSDTVGAFLVCVIWFGLGTAALLRWRGSGDVEMGGIEARLDTRAGAVAAILVVALGVTVLVETFSVDGLRTVEFAIDYLLVSVAILALSAVIVVAYTVSLRGISLDPPHRHVAGRSSGNIRRWPGKPANRATAQLDRIEPRGVVGIRRSTSG
jgi:hypothetical protein